MIEYGHIGVTMSRDVEARIAEGADGGAATWNEILRQAEAGGGWVLVGPPTREAVGAYVVWRYPAAYEEAAGE